MRHLGQREFFGSNIAPYAEVRLLIEFSDGGDVRLREDSELGGPRCPDVVNCLTPLDLVPDDQ